MIAIVIKPQSQNYYNPINTDLMHYKYIFIKFDMYFINKQPLSKYVVYKKLQKIKISL